MFIFSKTIKAFAFIFLIFISTGLQATDFTVTNTGDSGPGSLRQALTYANTTAGPHHIIFNIPQSDMGYDVAKGIWTIAPSYPLPYVMKAGINIDGTTQTQFGGNTNTEGPEIILYGGGTIDYGFSVMNVSDVSIKGFIVSGFIYGIQVTGNNASGALITGNYVGVNYNATDTLPNYIGVEILGSAHHCIVGGTTPEERNIISGNSHIGLRLLQSSNNTVIGNYIGLDRTGTLALPNYDGLSLEGLTQNNIIGGPAAGEGNVISGNVAYGLPLIGLDTRHNVIKGNFIGTNAQGTAAVPNTYGILFDDGSRYNTVGGYGAGEMNVISGNSGYGVFIYNLGTIENTVVGNLIGTDKTGTLAVPNANGIVADGAAKNHIIDGNTISGNLQQGIALHVAGTDYHTITRNKIGTDITGHNALPNGEDGIRIAEGCQMNIIGIAPDSGNVIAYNGANGINIMTDADLYNTISGNSIHGNTGLGIDLYFPGPNVNDAGDGDIGPNMRMNFPVITNAVYDSVSGITSVQGTLDTQNSENATIELFLSGAYNNGYGQGEVFLTQATCLPNGTFSTTFNHPLALVSLCATATDMTGNTSEFSENYLLPPPAGFNNLSLYSSLYKLFPNPANDKFYLTENNINVSTKLIEIYDINGKLLHIDVLHPQKPIYCRDFPEGLYQIKILNRSLSTFDVVTLMIAH